MATAAQLAANLREWLEFVDDPSDSVDDESENLVSGNVARVSLGKRYAEAGDEVHVHVLLDADGKFEQHCALFHRADVWPDGIMGEFAERRIAVGRVDGEIRAPVLVDVAELVEEGQGIQLRGYSSVVRLRVLDQCQYVSREILERFAHLAGKVEGVIENRVLKVPVGTASLGLVDQRPDELVKGGATVEEELTEDGAPQDVGVGGVVRYAPPPLFGLSIELLLNRAGVSANEGLERRIKALEVFLSTPEFQNVASLGGATHDE